MQYKTSNFKVQQNYLLELYETEEKQHQEFLEHMKKVYTL